MKSITTFAQLFIVSLALFFMVSWIQEQDAHAMDREELIKLHEILAAMDSECGPVIELDWPVDPEKIQL